MWKRFFAATALVIIATAVAGQVALAADEVHEGKVLAVSDGKITVFDKRDNESDTFVVTADTKVSRNGKPAKFSELQVGDTAKVTATSQGDKLIAKEIVAAAPE